MDAETEVQDAAFASMPADHPLMLKFQATLQAHLLRLSEQLQQEIADIDHATERLNGEREEVGASLYDFQREVERQKDAIDAYNESIKERFEARLRDEQRSRELKVEMRALQSQFDDCQSALRDKLTEARKIRSLEQSVERWHEEMQSEIEVSKRVLSKDKQDKRQKTVEKRQMDLLLLNLEADVLKSQAENHRLADQIQVQRDILANLNASITDANADLDIIQGEQKRLIGSWNDVVLAIKNRDKVAAKAMQELA